MSKADDAQAAAHEALQMAYKTGQPITGIIVKLSHEWELSQEVIKSWVLRNPSFESLEAIDRDVAIFHKFKTDDEIRRIERIRERECKFSELSQIIDTIPEKALLFAMLNTVGFAHAQSWRHWIKQNCWELESDRNEALEFANDRLKARFNNERRAHAPNQ